MLTTVAAEWFASKGITLDTLERFGVHTDEENAICFPYPSGTIKRRKNLPDGKRVFLWPKGKALELFNVNTPTAERHAFLVEGETDAMRLDQEIMSQSGAAAFPDVYGIPGIESWRPEWADRFK